MHILTQMNYMILVIKENQPTCIYSDWIKYQVTSSQLLAVKLWMEYVWGIHNTFDEERIILGVVFVIKVGEFVELWATQRHIHVCDRSLEAGALWCWLKGLQRVLAVVLAYQDWWHFVVKWPLEQSIRFSLHQNKKEGKMCLVSHPITTEVDHDAHLAAILSRVEQRTAEWSNVSFYGISSTSL